jgi:ketosteroid isomerase-like protein
MVQPNRHQKVAFAVIVAIACALIVTTSSSVRSETNDPVAQIRAALHDQQDAWNRGDIDAFMNGYARSGSTVFISEDTITRGWETVRDRYRQKYSSQTNMGKLTFSELEITPLSSDAAVAVGHWQLQRAKDQPHGRFTLIFKRLPEGWRIVLDHTSAASP